MPSLFWLALLLGFLTGVSAAVLLLPARLIEPLYGPLALTTVVVTAACGALLRLRWVRQNGSGRAAVPARPARGPSLPTDAADGPGARGLCPAASDSSRSAATRFSTISLSCHRDRYSSLP